MEIAIVLLLAALIIHYPRKDGPAIIKRRDGGCPIIDVTFDGDREEEMMLDTGASQTIINKKTADNLKVKPIGEKHFVMASGKLEKMPIGYVNSIEAGGVKVDNIEVAILDSNKEIGLLGQNFFEKYDIIIQRDAIEFNKPSK
ncbi:MAG: retropepsin-like aspartic protease [Rhizonema sp. PD38]|nr:retropepsin-like aspartic protease [Rhizonema sp. PD38]